MAKEAEHISKYKKLQKQAKLMIDTAERHHRGAYDTALDKVLTKDGKVDMELLDKAEHQGKFANTMADFYIDKAKGLFKTKEGAKFDDLEKELLINAYAGTTKTQLLSYARQLGKGFTFDKFYNDEQFRPKMMQKMKQNLGAATVGHFEDKHIDDILKYTKADRFIDKSKIQLEEAINILQEYEQFGTVIEKQHKKKLYYKKAKK